jgi:AcrR family transcriptional regulator
MMKMSISYESTGRTRQKARTREAIIAATRRLVASGAMPTVEQAADAADVSRATAYRYFPNQRDLVVALYAWVDAPSLLDPDAGDHAEQRLAAALERFTAILAENEPTLRAMLRLSLEPGSEDREDLVLRQGRRIRWVTDALEPMRARISPSGFERLVRAISATIGIECFVWLTDVAGLSKDDAIETIRWSASALLRTAMRDGERDAPRPAR